MKLSSAILYTAMVGAGVEAGKKANKENNAPAPDFQCPDCSGVIETFNNWHGNSDIVCSRYSDPRELFDERGACKECKIQCLPSEDKCPGISDLKAGYWNRTGVKALENFVNRAKLDSEARVALRRQNQLQKEMDKYEKAKKKQEEREAKAANKAFKNENWEAWRQQKREENEARRAERKEAKKLRKAEAKRLKEFKKSQREAKRLLADEQKSLFAFYASLEETYESICPDMYLIENSHFNTEDVKEFQSSLDQ